MKYNQLKANDVKVGDRVFYQFGGGSKLHLTTVTRITKTLICINHNNAEYKFRKTNVSYDTCIGFCKSDSWNKYEDKLYAEDDKRAIEIHSDSILNRYISTDKDYIRMSLGGLNYIEIRKLRIYLENIEKGRFQND